MTASPSPSVHLGRPPARFSPGTGTAVVGSGGVVLVAAGPEGKVVRTLLDPLFAGADFATTVDLLLGLGLAEIGDVAGAFVEADGIRVLVRGGVAVHIEDATGQIRVIEGRRATTWHEELIEEAVAATLALEGAATTDHPFAVDRGSVPAAAVRLDPGHPRRTGPVETPPTAAATPSPRPVAIRSAEAEAEPDDAAPSPSPAVADTAPPPAPAEDGAGPPEDLPSPSPPPVEEPDTAAPVDPDAVHPDATVEVAEATPSWPPPPPAAGSELDEAFHEVLGATRNWSPAVASTPEPVGPSPAPETAAEPGPGPDDEEQATGDGAKPDGQPTPLTQHYHTVLPPPPPAAAAPTEPAPTLPPTPTAGPVIQSVPTFGGTPPTAAAGHEVASAQTRPDGDPLDDRPTVARPTAGGNGAGHHRPLIQAVHCVGGHPNAPHGDACRSCGGPITDRSVTSVPRPSLATLVFDDGREVPLTGPLVLGRKPVPQVIDGESAVSIAVTDPEQVLSRSHAEVRLAGWQIQVVDRDSMNGTFVALPGRPPFRLHPGEPYPVPLGCRIVLGDTAGFELR